MSIFDPIVIWLNLLRLESMDFVGATNGVCTAVS